MVLSDLSIRRPVLATVMSLMLLLIGIIAYDRLTVREYPKIDVPVITVETGYPGASASIIETQVTQIIEDSLSGIEGVDFMSSISRSEKSQITINFKLDRDPDAAASDVRDRVGRVRGALPDDINEPIVAKSEADAQPIIWLAFSSDRHSPLEVSAFADKRVKDPLQTVSGVASIMIAGERRYAMRIWLDADRLTSYGLTPNDVESALRAQNIEVPAGRIESGQREFSVLTNTDLNTTDEFGSVIVRNDDSYPIRIRDVARIEIAPESERIIGRYNGKNAVAMGVVKQSTANPLDVSNGIKAEIERIKTILPEGMQVNVAYDSSIFIQASIDSVFKTLAEAGILVVLVIFFFLRNLRATLIPVVTIPLSLIGGFAIMYLLDYSVNTLTLLAMVLAIGLVVDDAIVMLENIYRHVEDGLSPVKAAFVGSREVGFAIVATTLTLVAVYVPVALTPGRTGKLFTEFALTLAGAVLISGFIALTLSPMMSSKMLRHEKKHSWLFNLIENMLNSITSAYQFLLNKLLRNGLLALIIMVGSAAGSWYFYDKLPKELAPVEDRGTIMSFSINPDGSSVDYVNRYSKGVERIIANVPEHNRYFTVVGFPSETNSLAFLGLKPWDERERKQQQIAAELTPQLFGGVTGNMTFAMNLPSLGQSIISRPVEFIIKSNGTYDDLKVITDKVMAQVYQNPMFVQPDTDLKLNKPELQIDIDRSKASDIGVPVERIGRTLESYIAGREVTRFKKEGDQYDVIVQVDKQERSSPSNLSDLYVRSDSGDMVQLSNVATVRETVAPRELNHFDKVKAVKLQAMLAPGYSIGEALSFLETTLQEVAPEASYDYGGQSREFKESSDSLQMTFALALIFIFLVLAAQFESFRNPFIILLSVPPAIFGALFALSITGGSFNIYSQIGLITLIGLIAKHGILIVEFANQLQEQGSNVKDAIMEAATLRLRPILMTTGATVLGALPLAWATGAGAESREQIGWVIVGGMLFGTLMTLFVIPTVYSFLGKRSENTVEQEYAESLQPVRNSQ
ncbi:efflux RND transporter permease subunit [Neptunomonas concharum]|uniref:Efflux RND transporter permease subunit n=1 Tax=Neptunomonas concharum TaxID=1031538 RepID=A0A5P1RDB0_9GAMM|nr:efflux RND transporter permease subunit [Neptunomonas concharum]QEQ97236.1 efflux RND transporter permease subunit [Neptunomonas concharum]